MSTSAKASLRWTRRVVGVVALGMALTAGGTAATAATLPSPQVKTVTNERPVSPALCDAMRRVKPDSACTEVFTSVETSLPVAGTVKASVTPLTSGCKTFTQWRSDSDGGLFWKFSQSGSFCYNGISVTSSAHHCWINYANGYTGHVDYCPAMYHSGSIWRYSDTTTIKAYNLPLSGAFRIWTDVSANGYISYHHD